MYTTSKHDPQKCSVLDTCPFSSTFHLSPPSLCLRSLTTRDVIDETGFYLQEIGGRGESEVICSLAPSCMGALRWLFSSPKASFSRASLPTHFFLSPSSTNHYVLLSLQIWGGNSSYYQPSQGYENPLIVFPAPAHTFIYSLFVKLFSNYPI